MTNRIAIIDFINQDVGLKILFPEADYFILQEEFNRTQIYSKYDMKPIVHNKDVNVYEYVTSDRYDIVFIIAALYNSIKIYNNQINGAFSEGIFDKLVNIKTLIHNNKFEKVCFFDNYDYDYDPNIIFQTNPGNNIYFFKRYYNKEKTYNNNVCPFPYIIFGHQCNIDMITDRFNKKREEQKQSRIFFSGSLMNHMDNTYGVYRNRIDLMNRIVKKVNVYNPGHVFHDTFIKILSTSKYCLDLLGVGDPNIRTFEILSCKSLRISQRSNLKWNFEDEFSEETIFDDENDLVEKIVRLENDPQLYQQCLEKQNEIVRKHMNIHSLRSYILGKININIT
jgi:spore maturation protein CgeB